MKTNKPEPWHAADEQKPAARKHGPIGTHSLTGSGAEVGLPSPPAGKPVAERSEQAEPPLKPERDLIKEPRAGGSDLLGR
jgi:hypothetical protein